VGVELWMREEVAILLATLGACGFLILGFSSSSGPRSAAPNAESPAAPSLAEPGELPQQTARDGIALSS